jgi:hypothetical protein
MPPGARALSLEEGPFSPPSVADQIALSDARVRARVSYVIIGAFLVVNLATLLGLYLIYLADAAELQAKLVAPNQRVIDSRVVMTLLGATTVQLGSMAVIMAKYLFPGARP